MHKIAVEAIMVYLRQLHYRPDCRVGFTCFEQVQSGKAKTLEEMDKPNRVQNVQDNKKGCRHTVILI